MQAVAGGVAARWLLQLLLANGVFHVTHDEFFADPFGQTVAVIKSFLKVVARVDVHQRKREFTRPEGFQGQMHERNGVLATRKQQRGSLKLPRHLPHDVDGFGFELV